MKMKKMFAAVFGLILALSMSMTAFAGTWRMDGGMWWYENDDGSYPANGFYFIRGEEYYFDVNGYMASSRWLHLTGDRWCYATGSGALAKNQWIGDYYFDDEGIMMTSTWTPDGYYVDADGKYNPSMGRQGASSGGDIPIGYYNSVGYTMNPTEAPTASMTRTTPTAIRWSCIMITAKSTERALRAATRVIWSKWRATVSSSSTGRMSPGMAAILSSWNTGTPVTETAMPQADSRCPLYIMHYQTNPPDIRRGCPAAFFYFGGDALNIGVSR